MPAPHRSVHAAWRSDEAIARRAGAGDDAAFATLYERYSGRLERYCRSILRHDEDARDAVQNAMTKALVALRRDERELVVRPWLFRIAHNEAISLLRRRRPAAELTEIVPDHRLDPHDEVLVREELSATLESVRALPERLAHPLLLREVSGLSYEQVGAVLSTSPDTARRAVSEARSALSDDRVAREEECRAIRDTLSDGDGRRRRARRVRSHLRGCEACRRWDQAQRARRRRLAWLPLGGGPGSAWAWLASVFGGGSSTAATSGAGLKVAVALSAMATGAVPAMHDAVPHRVPTTRSAAGSPKAGVTARTSSPRVGPKAAAATPIALAGPRRDARAVVPVRPEGRGAGPRERDKTAAIRRARVPVAPGGGKPASRSGQPAGPLVLDGRTTARVAQPAGAASSPSGAARHDGNRPAQT